MSKPALPAEANPSLSVSDYVKPVREPVFISKSARVMPTALVGTNCRPIQCGSTIAMQETIVADNTYIGNYSIIGAGSQLEESVIVDDFVKIERNVIVRRNTLVTYRAHLCNYVDIGDECVIGAFVTERTRIGRRCRVFGSVIHTHKDLSHPWDSDEAREESATINANVFLGFGAQIIGPVVIGSFVYISAGAIVTRDIPDRSFVYGRNCIEPLPGDRFKF